MRIRAPIRARAPEVPRAKKALPDARCRLTAPVDADQCRAIPPAPSRAVAYPVSPIAASTRGSAAEMRKVYEKLNLQFALERKKPEVGALISAVAALFALGAVMLSRLCSGGAFSSLRA